MAMPEKQRKQIEFIDEIYDKVVLKQDKKGGSNLMKQQKIEDKENCFQQQNTFNLMKDSLQDEEAEQQLNIITDKQGILRMSSMDHGSFYSQKSN